MDLLEQYAELTRRLPGDSERTRQLAIAVTALLAINSTDRKHHRETMIATHEAWTRDYHKLRHENIALRDEIDMLRQQLPTIEQAMDEPPATFLDRFIEVPPTDRVP